MSKKLFVLILLVFGAFGIVLLSVVFGMTGGIVNTADAFFSAMEEGDYDTAYSSLSEEFHGNTSIDELRAFAQESALAEVLRIDVVGAIGLRRRGLPGRRGADEERPVHSSVDHASQGGRRLEDLTRSTGSPIAPRSSPAIAQGAVSVMAAPERPHMWYNRA